MDQGTAERRCQNCHALVTADASWCGQCYASLERPRERAGPEAGASISTTSGEATAGGERPAPTWPCAVCGEANPLEADACTSCGTPFAAMMRLAGQEERASPRDALAWSLVFPGLGLRKSGLPLDGLARGVLFTMTFGMALLIGLGGARSGTVFGLFLVYLVLALAVYGGSAYEAYVVARGGSLLVPSRPLMWATVGLMLLSVVALAVAVGAATSR